MKTRIRALERLVVELSSRIECLEDRCLALSDERANRAHRVLCAMALCGGRQHSHENAATLRRLEKELEDLSDPLYVDTSFEIDERSPPPRELPREARTPEQ